MKRLAVLLLMASTCLGAVHYYKADSTTHGGAESSWATAGSPAELFLDIAADANIAAGDTLYIEEGTYTMTADVDGSGNDGTTTNPVWIIGVKHGTTNDPPVLADHAFGSARPTITDGAGNYMLTLGDYHFASNLILSGDDTSALNGSGAGSVFINCLIDQLGTGAKNAVAATTATKFYGCEIRCTNATPANTIVNVTGGTTMFAWCYIHGGKTAFGTAPGSILNCVIANCDVNGVVATTTNNLSIRNTVFYKCGTAGATRAGSAIYCTTGYGLVAIGCVFVDCFEGIRSSTAQPNAIIDWNVWHGNTYDVNGVTKGLNDLTADPLFTNADGGDFTVTAGSPCLNAMGLFGTNTGLTGSYMWNRGVDQDDNAAGGTTIFLQSGSKNGGKQ
jgi:hypothetical protein